MKLYTKSIIYLGFDAIAKNTDNNKKHKFRLRINKKRWTTNVVNDEYYYTTLEKSKKDLILQIDKYIEDIDYYKEIIKMYQKNIKKTKHNILIINKQLKEKGE